MNERRFRRLECSIGFYAKDSRNNPMLAVNPWTKFGEMRQSIDTFRLEKASNEILALLAEFRKQWNRYTESMDKVGKRLDDTMRAYTDVVGVRTRQLDRQLDKIEDLRTLRRDSETAPLNALTDSSILEAPAVRQDSNTP